MWIHGAVVRVMWWVNSAVVWQALQNVSIGTGRVKNTFAAKQGLLNGYLNFHWENKLLNAADYSVRNNWNRVLTVLRCTLFSWTQQTYHLFSLCNTEISQMWLMISAISRRQLLVIATQTFKWYHWCSVRGQLHLLFLLHEENYAEGDQLGLGLLLFSHSLPPCSIPAAACFPLSLGLFLGSLVHF